MGKYKIVCIEGERKGSELYLKPRESITIGRDSKTANLVFRDITISRKHCLVESGDADNYYVTDYSSCGIVTEDGINLKPGERTELARGTVLLIGKSGTKIRLV